MCSWHAVPLREARLLRRLDQLHKKEPDLTTASTILLSAVLLRLLSVSAPAEPVQAGVCALPVILYTDFKKEHSELSFEAMKEEVAAIMAPAGVQFQWRSVSQTESTPGELVVVSFTGRCRMNDLLLPHPEPGPLGWTYMADGHTSPFTHVDCDRVREFINPLVAGAGWDQRETLLGRALGRVLVHELYHVFSDSNRHASRGLRKASCTARDLLAEPQGLDSKDVNTLRHGKFHRLFQTESQPQPGGCQ